MAEQQSNSDLLLEEARGSYLRASSIAQERGAAAGEVELLRRSAFRQFLEQFRNFEGAAELVTANLIGRKEALEVVEDLLKKPELQTMRIFCYNKGKPSSRSMAEQLRKFITTYLS
jgi:hypothetical protein